MLISVRSINAMSIKTNSEREKPAASATKNRLLLALERLGISLL